jgi:hypothetical protein
MDETGLDGDGVVRLPRPRWVVASDCDVPEASRCTRRWTTASSTLTEFGLVKDLPCVISVSDLEITASATEDVSLWLADAACRRQCRLSCEGLQ